MTEPTRYTALAARLLRERPAAKESRLSRDVGISVVADAMAMRRKRRSARAFGIAGGVAAAAAVALFIGLSARTPGATAGRCHGAECAGGSGRKASPHGLDVGQSIVAPAGAPTSVVLASGTQIALDAKSVLECRDATTTQRFALLRGGAHLHVAKLHQNERFLVDTPHAEVEVRGTVFDVQIEPATSDCDPRTVVSVHEGRVEVRAAGTGVSLTAGEHWSSACTRPADPTPSAPAKSASVALRAHPAARATATGRSVLAAPNLPAPPAPASTPADSAPSALSEQNDLYASAEAARRAGRSTEALLTYARLLARFPRGQLAESAVVERARLLARTDPASARAEAERYLARYPAGFARAEMQALTPAP